MGGCLTLNGDPRTCRASLTDGLVRSNLSAITLDCAFGFLRRSRSVQFCDRIAVESTTPLTTLPENSGSSRDSLLGEDRLAWLALALSPGLGPKRILDAMRQLDRAAQVFALPLTALEGLRFPAEAAQFIFDGKARAAAEAEAARVAALGASLVSFGCPEYPERLKEIYDPPPVLWVRGDAALLSRPSIAVVGTRHPTPYGSGIAELLSRDLAARRLLIVSGMARGIDSCAHRGALSARMPTVAVWGTALTSSIPKKTRSWPRRFWPRVGRL